MRPRLRLRVERVLIQLWFGIGDLLINIALSEFFLMVGYVASASASSKL